MWGVSVLRNQHVFLVFLLALAYILKNRLVFSITKNHFRVLGMFSAVEISGAYLCAVENSLGCFLLLHLIVIHMYLCLEISMCF